MLGLGLKNNGMYSNGPTVTATIDTVGNFSIEATLGSDIDYFKIVATKVDHLNNATDNNNDPKVIVSDLVVKINGTASSQYDLDSSNMGGSNNFTYITYISSNSFSFEDNQFGFGMSAVTIYDDTTTSFSAQGGDTILITGNAKLDDGTAYVPQGGTAESGRIQFEFNDSANRDRLQVFLDPNYSGSGDGTILAFTKVDS